MNLVNAILAETETLPPISALGYEYVVAGNGIFIRAEDSRLSALVPIADDLTLHGLVALEPFVEFKLPRVPEAFLRAILESARRHLPNEAMYQFIRPEQDPLNYLYNGWGCRVPRDLAAPTSVSLDFDDDAHAVIDLHSHATMDTFFSTTDDADERGFRVYCVIGKVDTDTPEILCRVGVYGHHMLISADTIFEGIGIFRDAEEDARAEKYADELEANKSARDVLADAMASNDEPMVIFAQDADSEPQS